MPRSIALIIRAAVGLCLAVAVAIGADRARAQEGAQLVILEPDGARLAALDRAALAALPQTEFTTHTIWTEGPQRFEGVSLATLLAHHGIEAERLDLVAVNDYMVSLPADGIGPVFPVIAHSRNGAPMRLRDKGPYWLVYDYDASPEYQRETVYMRSIWQLDRITAYPARR
ncbi:MAG: oxidoreductase [Roseovarius sp.]|nr:oxidoreductase [Roseovarius sp.]